MDTRRKVYHKTGNNSQRIHEIRESIRVRSLSKKSSEDSEMPSKERHRSRDDVRDHMREAEPYLDASYEAKCDFLNRLSRKIQETRLESLTDNEFFESICHLMLKFLRDDHPCIRAMCFHVVRKCTMNERNLVVILTTHIDIYIVRAVDLQMENQTERVEAFKLILWMLKIYETSNLKKLIDTSAAQKTGKKYAFPKSIMQPIISIALAAFEGQHKDQSKEGKDKLALPCVGLFLEFCLTEPTHILEMAGTDWLVKVLTGVSCMSKRIVLLSSHVLISWLDTPSIRVKSHLHLVTEQIFAPLIEFGLFQKKESMVASESGNESLHMNDFLENLKCSFLCLLRSWPGLFACAAVGPNANILPSSPFRLLDYLGLGSLGNENLLRIRDVIVDLCCEFIDVPYASKTFDSWEEALMFYRTMHLPDKYKSSLKHDFVIAQNEARLKNDTERIKPTIDLLGAFRALSQFVLINAQLPLSLARLILAMPDSSSGLKATLLMADMLRQAPSHVPTGWRAPVLSMPLLVQSACESLSQSHAVAAINGTFDINAVEQYTFLHATNAELVLNRFDKLNQSWIRSASNSSTVLKESDLQLFVPHLSDPIVVSAPIKKSKSETSFRAVSVRRNISPDIYEEESPGDFLETVLLGPYDKNKLMLMENADDCDYFFPITRDTFDDEEENAKKMFVDSNGAFDWNYVEYYVENIEKDGYDKLVKEFSSNTIEVHIGNIFNFLSPTELDKSKRILDRQHTIVAKSFIRLLLRVIPNHDSIRRDYTPILQKYIASFRAVLEERTNHSAYFAPRTLSLNGSMLHFAIIGTFTMTSHGLAILNDVGVLHMYLDMMTCTGPLEYVKVIVSSLDYTNDGLARVILRKALTSTSEASRKWTTRYLSVLASRELPMFSDWGIQLMLRQLADESSKVVRHTIRLLNRWLPEHPSRNLRKVEWSLFGDAGNLLRAHIYAVESECALDEDEVREVIQFWMKEYNQTYLRIIDEDMQEVMFQTKRSIDGGFSRASSERPDTSLGVMAPLHLFAALGRHETGRRALIDENVCGELLATCSNSKNFEEVKSSLLAFASIGSTNDGFEILPHDAVPTIIKISEEHNVLTVRGVAFWALAIMSQCVEGAKRIAAFGWECNRFRYATDLAKAKNADEEPTTSATIGSISSSWKPPRKVTHQHHRHSSILELQIHGKQSRAKSESVLVRRGHSKGRARCQSEGDIHALPSRRETRIEVCCSQRLWNSELYLYKSSGTSDSSSFPYHKRTVTNSSPAHHLQEEVSVTVSVAQDPEDTVCKSVATTRLSTDRRRANTTNSLFDEEEGMKTRSSTVARCTREGLKMQSEQLEAEGMMLDVITEPHFSCRLREKYHLAPFRVRTTLQINRHVGEPVRYVFMSREEERHFADYRSQVLNDPWLYNELKKEDNAVKKIVNVVPVQTVALPAEIEILCGNIFPSKPKNDPIFVFEEVDETTEVEDRGARTGHARSTMRIQPHSTYRCFHCSSNEDKVRTYPHPDAPTLRKEVLGQVDMLEIKEYPVKRLIGLRQDHPWLFEWPCMYADVLELLDEYRFKPHSRAFLQQIFYDALQL